MNKPTFEQRRSYRVAVGGVATVHPKSGASHRYSLADVSLGGVRLRGAPDAGVGAVMKGTLRLPGVPPIRLRGHVVRIDDGAFVVEFDELFGDSEDLIHEVALRALERVPLASVLVVHRHAAVRQSLGHELRGLGQRVIIAATPLEVLTWLTRPATPIASVAVDINLGLVPTSHLLRFIADSYPGIKRFVIADESTADLAHTEVLEGRADEMLRMPWEPEILRTIAQSTQPTRAS